MTTTTPMSRQDVLAAVKRNYAEFDELLSHFDASQMQTLCIHTHWTVKDVLGHLASWEKLEVGWIDDVIADKTPLLYAPGYVWDLVDRRLQSELIRSYNRHVLEQCPTRSLRDVLDEFRQTQRDMLAVVGRLPDMAFVDPGVLFWIQLEVPRDPWTPVPVNCHEHYHQHARWLRDWMAQEK